MQCVQLLYGYPFHPFLHMEKPFHIWKTMPTCRKSELIRNKNSSKYLNLGVHNFFSKLLVTFSSISTYGKLPSTDHKPLLYMEKRYFCDHQTAFQLFPHNHKHLTAVTNFLYPLRWHSVHWLHLDSFPPMKNSHWPQTPSIHGKAVFLWLPDSFAVISTASDSGYKLPTMAQSVHWLHLDSFPHM